MQVFTLPDPGEGLVEAEIVTWRVAVGDTVAVNDVVVEIETSKSIVELPSPFAGTVRELLVEAGTTVEVGSPIIAIDDGSGAGSAGDEDEPAGPNLVGYGARAAGTTRRARRGSAAPVAGGDAVANAAPSPVLVEDADDGAAQTHEEISRSFDAPAARPADQQEPLAAAHDEPRGGPLPGPGHAPHEPGEERGPVLAKPPTRLLARQLGVDLTTLTGSGEGGVITRGDVEAAGRATSDVGDVGAAASAGSGTGEVVTQPAADDPDPDAERVPVRGTRRATAAAMVASAFTAPHVTEWVEVDVTATMELLDRLRQRRDLADLRLTPLVLVARAVCRALGRTPELNSSWVDGADGAEIVRHPRVNLGVAASTPRGLLVPHVAGAEGLGLRQLAEALSELVVTAREGRTQPAALRGGTFTITNVGVFGVDAGTPILNPGESGILCLGAITRKPWVVGAGPEERVEPRWVTTLAVSFDHRVVDGAEGSRFLADVAAQLHDPAAAAVL